MVCSKCKYYREGMLSNSCELFGFENFYQFTNEKTCDLVNDDFSINKNNEDVEIIGYNEAVL